MSTFASHRSQQHPALCKGHLGNGEVLHWRVGEVQVVEHADVAPLIFAAVDAVNELLPADEQIPKDLDAPLFTRDGGIDSISLVHLVSEFEALLEQHVAPGVVLADERAMSRSASPFRTLSTLLEYALEQLERLPPSAPSP